MTIYGFHKLESTLKSMENVGSDDRYFEGLLTVQMKDKQGEVTIVDELYKVLPVWIDRGAPISDTHSNRIVGKGINYSRTTVKNGEGHELPAIKITGKIFKNYELDNVIWNKIKNNEYKGLSFGGATRSARSPIKMKDGSTAYALSDLEHYEVAVCADPAVPMAIITDFNQIAKANFNSSVRDDGKMVIQCENMGCYVKKDSLIKIEDDEDDNTQVTVLDEWKNETHPDKNGKTEGIRTTKADEDKPLNKPMRDDGDKKFKVYVKDPKTGKTVTVRFGDPNMEIKRDDPERRASFRARHDCENAKDITTPQYWSCKMWEKETSVTDHTNKTGGGDMLSVMEGDKPEKYNEVEAGRQRGRPIDVPVIKEGGGHADKDNFADPDKSLLLDDEEKKKFMEKKEMLEATIDNPNEKEPTQTHSGERKEETSGYKLEKAIEIINKAGYQVFTEDKTNGTGINDLQREKRRFNGTRGTLSEELPRRIQQANLNESQTFEQKVQTLMREGKSRESAEKIVGSFVHKVEASSGSGGAGIGGANMTNGGTLTTSTGGANNPTHNNGCDCTCKDCKRNDKCNCCEKCKKKSKGLDISNTGSGGTTEQAFNQNPPNAGRLNNKSTDDDDDEVQLSEGGQEVFDEASRYANSVNHFKSANTIEVNKVHALLKLNKVRDRGVFGQTKIQTPTNANTGNLSQPFGRKNRGNKEMKERERKSRARMFHTSHGDGETELARKLPTTKEPTKPKTTKVPYNKYRKRDETERSAELVNSLEKALTELKKLQISGGLGSRGLGSEHGYTQGQGETTQITLIQPRPTDDRVEAKCIPKDDDFKNIKRSLDELTKIRSNRGAAPFGSDVGGTGSTSTAVADENTVYMDANGNKHSTQAEAEAVPPRKRMNRRVARQRREDYKADTRQTIGQRTGHT
jgi:hypothetical protein